MTALDPSVRGNQPAGPARWARAAQWAAAMPDSVSGQLYFSRLTAAVAVATAAGDREWEVWRRVAWENEPRFHVRACSTRCAVLQLQLSAVFPPGHPSSGEKVTGLTALKQYMSLSPGQMNVALVEGTGTRTGACAVCGSRPGVV